MIRVCCALHKTAMNNYIFASVGWQQLCFHLCKFVCLLATLQKKMIIRFFMEFHDRLEMIWGTTENTLELFSRLSSVWRDFLWGRGEFCLLAALQESGWIIYETLRIVQVGISEMLRASTFSPVNKIHNFQCMGKIFLWFSKGTFGIPHKYSKGILPLVYNEDEP